jgi:hypothetical protein
MLEKMPDRGDMHKKCFNYMDDSNFILKSSSKTDLSGRKIHDLMPYSITPKSSACLTLMDNLRRTAIVKNPRMAREPTITPAIEELARFLKALTARLYFCKSHFLFPKFGVPIP